MVGRGGHRIGHVRVGGGWRGSTSWKRRSGIGNRRHVKIDCRINLSISGDKIMETSWRIITLINKDGEEKTWGEWSWINDLFWEPV